MKIMVKIFITVCLLGPAVVTLSPILAATKHSPSPHADEYTQDRSNNNIEATKLLSQLQTLQDMLKALRAHREALIDESKRLNDAWEQYYKEGSAFYDPEMQFFVDTTVFVKTKTSEQSRDKENDSIENNKLIEQGKRLEEEADKHHDKRNHLLEIEKQLEEKWAEYRKDNKQYHQLKIEVLDSFQKIF